MEGRSWSLSLKSSGEKLGATLSARSVTFSDVQAGTLGRALFAAAQAGFGIQYLVRSLGAGPAPGPPWLPLSPIPAGFAGFALLLIAAAIMTGEARRWAANLLCGGLLIFVCLYYLPKMAVSPRDPHPWTRGFELLAMAGATLLLPGKTGGFRAMQAGRLLIAVALVVFGVQHFIYAQFTATLVPAWIPWRLFWAWFAGFAFVAAALGLTFRREMTLAPVLLGTMFFLWVVLLHAPRVLAFPQKPNEWTSALVCLAMAGAGFIAAEAAIKCERNEGFVITSAMA